MFGLRAIEAVRNVTRRHKLGHVSLIVLVTLLGSAVLVFEFEKPVSDASITSLPTALWWAISTMTTVGYGDVYPRSPGGKGIAVLPMLIGVGVFGLLPATLASYFVEQDAKDDERAAAAERAEILERLGRIERKLEER